MSSSKKRLAPSETVACEKAARGVWLVKVPRYLSEIWQKNPGKTVGSLVTGQHVVFKNNPELEEQKKPAVQVVNQIPSSSRFAANNAPQPIGKKKETMNAPKEYKFNIKDMNNQSMAILVEDKTGLEENEDIYSGKLTVEGRVSNSRGLVFT